MAQGDERALLELHERHGSFLERIVARHLGANGETEEVVQEVFLEVWDRAVGYRAARGTPRAWLTVLAKSRALDRLRSRRARAMREAAVAAETLRLHPSRAGAVELMMAREQRRRLVAALGALPNEQRECLLLAYFGGLSGSEIAARLNTPLGTVKSRVALGLRRLRRTFGRNGGVELALAS